MKRHLSLEEYKRGELELAIQESRRGLLVHILIAVIVIAALIVINVLLAPEFPWSIFPVIGMSLGVAFHYLGIRHVTRDVHRHQSDIEFEVSRRSA